MRCQICDCSNSNNQSLYNNSLTTSFSGGRRVRYYKRYNKYLCLECKQSLYPNDTVDKSLFVPFGDLLNEK